MDKDKQFKRARYRAQKQNFTWKLSLEQFSEIGERACMRCGREPAGYMVRKDQNGPFDTKNCEPCCLVCRMSVANPRTIHHLRSLNPRCEMCGEAKCDVCKKLFERIFCGWRCVMLGYFNTFNSYNPENNPTSCTVCEGRMIGNNHEICDKLLQYFEGSKEKTLLHLKKMLGIFKRDYPRGYSQTEYNKGFTLYF
jgi:hypothetical protein